MIQEIYLVTGGLVGVTVFAIRVQGTANNTAKNLSEFKKEMNKRTDNLKVELNTKVDKLERCVLEKIESLEKQNTKTQLEVVEIKGDTKHIRESLHHIINLFNQHVLSKDAQI